MTTTSLEQTQAILLNMGFIAHKDNQRFLDHPDWYMEEKDFNYGINLQAYIYDSQAGYCCIDLDGDYMAPCLTSEDGVELLEFMNEHYVKRITKKVYMWPDGEMSSTVISYKSDDYVTFDEKMSRSSIRRLVIKHMGYNNIDEIVSSIMAELTK